MQQLVDSFGREFYYLRLSVTDRCNFSCKYCLPNGYIRLKGASPELTLDEIRNLVSAFAEMGFRKVRLTGGEPTLRRDLLQIIDCVSNIQSAWFGSQEINIALSTNGFRLARDAKRYFAAGIRSLNISADSLKPERFAQVTGEDLLHEVLGGIDTALDAGFSWIKVNTVLMQGINTDEVDSFVNWIQKRPITVRFIELMQTGENSVFFSRHHVSAKSIREKLTQSGWKPRPRTITAGPAVEFSHPEFLGRVGLITPYGKDFCSTCNRLRISSRGSLKLCLFGNKDYSLRHLLQHESQREELIAAVFDLIQVKAATHFLHQQDSGVTANLSVIGG